MFSEKCSEKRPLLNNSFTLDDVPETHKRRKNSDYHQPKNSADNFNGAGAEGPVCSDTTTPEEKEDKPPMCLSLNASEMMQRKFWPPNWKDTFTLSEKSDRVNLGSSNAIEPSNARHVLIMQDGTTVCTSWEKDKAIPEIKRIANLGHEIIKDDGPIMETITLQSGTSITALVNREFQEYAQNASFLISKWAENPQRDDVYLKIGIYVLQLQRNDFYVVPQYKHSLGSNKLHQIMRFDERKLSYAKLKPTTTFSKKCSEPLFYYMMGNHNKVDSIVRSPEDAIAVAAILFSEVIRNPEMFFHNIVLIHSLKSWDDFCNHHPMLTGGSWKHQASREKPPKKVTQKTQKNLKEFLQKTFFTVESLGAIPG